MKVKEEIAKLASEINREKPREFGTNYQDDEYSSEDNSEFEYDVDPDKKIEDQEIEIKTCKRLGEDRDPCTEEHEIQRRTITGECNNLQNRQIFI